MRGVPVLLVLLLVAPPVAAHHGENDAVWSDPAGDVEDEPVDHPSELDPHTGADAIDLTSVWIGHETADDVEFGLVTVADEPAQQAPPDIYNRALFLGFDRGTVHYSMIMYPDIEGRPCPVELLAQGPGSDRSREVGCLDLVSRTASEGGFATRVEKALLADEFGVAAAGSMSLRNVTASSGASRVMGWSSSTDTLDRGGDFTFALSAQEIQGDLRLGSPAPARASNGEATTLVYELVIRNVGDADSLVTLTSATQEPAFDVRVTPAVKVPAGEVVRVPVVLSMGFLHRHGESGSFVVTANDEHGSEVSQTFVVRWLDIPQPSGHHPEVFLHAAQRPVQGEVPEETGIVDWDTWSNTRADDSARGAEGGWIGIDRSTLRSSRFVLDPAIALGIHASPNETAHFSGKVRAPHGASDLELRIDARHCWTRPAGISGNFCEDENLTSLGAGTFEADLGVGEEAEVEVDLTGLEAEYVRPPAEGAFLEIRVSASYDPMPRNADLVRPSLEFSTDGAVARLPLKEYHDAADLAFSAGAATVHHLGDPVRNANPGGTLVFPLQLASSSEDLLRLDSTVVARDGIVAVVQPEGARLEPGGTAEVALQFTVPQDAVEGQQYNVVVVWEDPDHPAAIVATTATLRIVSEDTESVADEAVSEPAVESPMVSPLLVGIAILVLRRRRRLRD